jgi:hypothetical protein
MYYGNLTDSSNRHNRTLYITLAHQVMLLVSTIRYAERGEHIDLERPFYEILASGKPDFPFRLCWANKNWTKTWSSSSEDVLLEQNYSHEDDLAHIRSLIPVFSNQRYIRIDGKSLFLVNRSEILPNPLKTTEIWRKEALKQGIGELYLVRAESFNNDINPKIIDFDAAVEFAPDWDIMGSRLFNNEFLSTLAKIG